MIRALILSLLLASPALAEAPVIASWATDSGSLPPEYAWETWVTFTADRQVTVIHCKGYAVEAPGCATITARLSKAKFQTLQEALAPFAAALVADPAEATDDVPVGGGSRWGRVVVDGVDYRLPGYPGADDAARVNQILDLLQAATPQWALANATAKAVQPTE